MAIFTTCPTCHGEGRLYTVRYTWWEPVEDDAGECPTCEGDREVEVESEPVDCDDDLVERELEKADG